MKQNTAAALDFINRQGLDNSEWNVMISEVSCSYYGNNLSTEVMMQPHIALYHEKGENWSIYDKCDYALQSDELGTIYIYEL